MRAFAHLPSKRRVAGVIAFALLVLSAFSAVHHHNLAVVPETAAFTLPSESDSARTSDCFVCRNLVSARELVPHVAAPDVVITDCAVSLSAEPALAETYASASPRAPPIA